MGEIPKRDIAAFRYVEERITEESREHVSMIGRVAIEDIRERFNINIEDWRIPLVIFGKTFEAIQMSLEDAKKEGVPKAVFRIAHRLVVGYSDTGNGEDLEKQGNYVPYMDNLIRINVDPAGRVEKDDPEDEEEEINEELENKMRTPFTAATEWMVKNRDEKFAREIDRIAARTIDSLCALDINLKQHVFIIPLFSSVYEAMIYYAINHRQDDEVPIFIFDMLGFFRVISFIDDVSGMPKVKLEPAVEPKAFGKNDAVASSKFE